MDLNQAVFYDGIMTAVNNFILFGIVVLIRQVIHKENIRSFLIHFDRKGAWLFAEGVAIGFLLFLLYPLILIVSGQGIVSVSRDAIMRTSGLLVTSGLGFLGVAVFEEGLFRGYILQKLLPLDWQPSYLDYCI